MTTTLAVPICRVSPVPNCVYKRALFALEIVGIAQWFTFLLLLRGHTLSDWGSIGPRRIDLFIQCSFLSDLWSILQVLSHLVISPSLLLPLLHCELKFFSLQSKALFFCQLFRKLLVPVLLGLPIHFFIFFGSLSIFVSLADGSLFGLAFFSLFLTLTLNYLLTDLLQHSFMFTFAFVFFFLTLTQNFLTVLLSYSFMFTVILFLLRNLTCFVLETHLFLSSLISLFFSLKLFC